MAERSAEPVAQVHCRGRPGSLLEQRALKANEFRERALTGSVSHGPVQRDVGQVSRMRVKGEFPDACSFWLYKLAAAMACLSL